MKVFCICLEDELYSRIKCSEMIVDKDGILLAALDGGQYVAMYKEWSYWVEEGHEVTE